MNDQQKYVFDLQGYIVLEGVVPPATVAECNSVLDRYENMNPADYPAPLVLGDERTEKNLYISNILEGDPAFRHLIDLPGVIDIIAGVSGDSFRLNHT